MNQLQQIITHLSEIEKIEEQIIIHRKTMRAVFLRDMAQWIAHRVLKIPEMEIRLFFNFQRNLSVTQAIDKMDKEIINQNFYTINYIITICKDLNMIPANPDGTSYPSDSFNTLLKYLPSALRSMAQTTGNTSTTDMTATKQLSSGTWSEYEKLTLDSVLTFEEAIECYRIITGACSFGTKNFVETILPEKDKKASYSIREMIEITRGQYGHETFKSFFK